MGATFDQYSHFNNGVGSVATVTHSFTIGASANAAVAALAVASATTISGITATWNGVSMTQIAGTLNTVGLNNSAQTVLFGITASQMGASAFTGTHNLVFSWTGSGTVAIALASFGGCDQTGGATTFLNGTTSDNNATTSTTTKTVTTAAGNATVGIWDGGSTFTGTQTPTVDWQDNVGGAGNLAEGQHLISVSASDSYTARLSATDWLDGSFCSILGVAVQPMQVLPGAIQHPAQGPSRGLRAVQAYPKQVDTFANSMQRLFMHHQSMSGWTCDPRTRIYRRSTKLLRLY